MANTVQRRGAQGVHGVDKEGVEKKRKSQYSYFGTNRKLERIQVCF